jgi:malic enzyme
VAQVGLGAPYFIGRLLGLGNLNPTEVANVMFGYGNTFLVTAGLMNMLLIMDAFDIVVGRKE